MGDSTPGCAADASDFDINAVSQKYPEIEQASFARGYTSIFNPDYTSESTTDTTETTETTGTTEPAETSDTTSGSEPEETTEPSETTPSETTSGETTTEVTTLVIPSGEVTTTGEPGEPDEDVVIDTDKFPLAGSDFKIDIPFSLTYENDAGLIVELGTSKLLDTLNRILLSIAIAALVIDLCIIGWYLYWRRHFAKKDSNGKAIAYYHYFELMARLFRYSLPRKARFIAEKAAFAPEKITPREAEALAAICSKDMNEISMGFNKYKRFLYKALFIKITSK